MASSAYVPYAQAERRSVPSRSNPALAAVASMGVLSVRVSICRRCSPRTVNPYSHSVCRTSTASPRPRNAGRRAIPTCAVRLCVSMLQRRASPISSCDSSSTTEKHAASSDGPVTAKGEWTEPGGMGRQGRESARDRVATSSYSSDCRTGTSLSCRARSPTLSPRITEHCYTGGINRSTKFPCHRR